MVGRARLLRRGSPAAKRISVVLEVFCFDLLQLSTNIPPGASVVAIIGTIVASVVILTNTKDEQRRDNERRAANRDNNAAVLKTLAQREDADHVIPISATDLE
jgi:hypothetical protein